MDRYKKNKLIDFCYDVLGTTVSTVASFNDDFPPSNLISSNLQIRSNGFLADYFIKPPVGVRFTFRHPIHLSRLTFQPQVGQQSCQLFEIWAWDEEPSIRDGIKVGRSSNDHPSGRVTFQNFYFPGNRFRPDDDAGKFRLTPNELLKNVSTIEIKILRANQSGIPCLKNVEIFGVASQNVAADEVRKTTDLWEKLSNKSLSTPQLNPQLILESERDVESFEKSTDVDAEIPSDFLDALTHARMDVPMVLPCGQVIDRKTLDQYTKEEAAWGRTANDPFTGKLFSSTSRPIFDEKLKARIDAFVLGSHGIVVSDVKKRGRELMANSVPSTSDQSSSSSPDQSSSSSQPQVKEEIGAKKRCIDDIVSQALSGRKTIILGSRPAPLACTVCQKKENLYQFRCRHLICRSCLDSEVKKSTENCCSLCKKIWLKKDVIKFHSVTT